MDKQQLLTTSITCLNIITKLLTKGIILKFVDFNARWKPGVCIVRSKKKCPSCYSGNTGSELEILSYR